MSEQTIELLSRHEPAAGMFRGEAASARPALNTCTFGGATVFDFARIELYLQFSRVQPAPFQCIVPLHVDESFVTETLPTQ